MLKELQRDREEQTRKWDEQKQDDKRKWDEQNQKWEEHTQDDKRKWDEQKQDDKRKWDEQNQKWWEQSQKWWEKQKDIDRLYEEIKALNRKHDQTIGSLGARWELYNEASLRNALMVILKDSFKGQVLHVTEFDDKGEVFGRPDQVEIDLIVKNRLLIIYEIKFSISKADMYIFERKARFYEKLHECKANRIIIISPVVEDKVKVLASKLGIEVYSYAEDVENI